MRIFPGRILQSLSLAGVFSLGLALTLSTAVPVRAQFAPANAVTVKLLDPIDSAQGAAGQRYHAAVAKDTAVDGVFLAKGADATITLTPGSGGNRWTLNLIELTVNGKVAGVLGVNPVVVPTGAGDFLTMSKKTITTLDRIAVAAGENIRFILGPANGQPAMPPVAAGNAPVAAPQSGASGGYSNPPSAEPVDRSAAYRNAPVAGPKPGGDAHIGLYGAVLYGNHLHLEARLDGCTRQATASSSCDFSIWDRNPPQMIGMSIGGFGLVDGKGQVIGLAGEGSKCCEGRNRSVIVPGVISHAHYTYSGLDPDVSRLARVSLKIYEAGSGNNDDFEFRDVPLGAPAAKPEAFTPVSRLPRKLVAEENSWRFSVARCSPMANPVHPEDQLIECFFKVENLKADRIIEVRSALLVDDQGRTYDASWPFGDATGNIGDSAAYAHTGAVPRQPGIYKDRLDGKLYNQPPLQFDSPRYVYAAFPDLPKNIHHIAHIEYIFNEQPTPGGLQRQFPVSFDDIELTPMPVAKSAH